MNEIFAWNNLIANLPNPHFLQTYEWGQVKAKVGWQPLYLTWSDAGFSAQTELSNLQPATVKAAALVLKKNVLSRGFAARLCVLYSPKGPLMDWGDESLRKRVLDDLQGFARKQGAIFLKLDPDVVLGTGIPLRGTFPGGEADLTEPGGEAVRADLSARGWRFSEEQIQFRNTVTLDVATSEEEMLSRMKQKTRYIVRLGAKKGVSVRVGGEADWPMLYKMYAETSVRDGFVIRDEGYYRTVWESFRCQVSGTRLEPLAEPLVAEVNGEAVAAVFLFAFAGRAYYVYGMSREAHRELMPNYLLQWEAMKWAKARGCSVYDLWGAPEVFEESDSMWGVFRFKEGLGGQVVRTLGAWDFVPNPLWYAMYTKAVPTLLDIMRFRGKAKTRQQIGG